MTSSTMATGSRCAGPTRGGSPGTISYDEYAAGQPIAPISISDLPWQGKKQRYSCDLLGIAKIAAMITRTITRVMTTRTNGQRANSAGCFSRR